MTPEQSVHCYNKGCGKQFNPIENTSEECVYHSGAPVFHDAYKSWSCCEKKTTDFTEFLNIKGCCKGTHNPVKPADPVPTCNGSVEVPEVIRPPERMKRPSESEAMIPLPTTISASLQKLLNNMTVKDDQLESESKELVCQRKGCGKSKEGSDDDKCCYHAGSPIFHEGMKYWSCCNKKTTDFNQFLAQKGCTEGAHQWTDPSQKKEVQCRYDWHQTGDTVNFTVYAKKIVPEECSISCNPVKLQLEIFFGDNQVFSFDKVLAGIVDPEQSKATFFATKLEVSMRKAEFVAWPSSFVF